MKEIQELRIQLTRIVTQSNSKDRNQPQLENDGGEVYKRDANPDDPEGIKGLNQLPPPSREQKVLLRQIISSGFIDQVARRVPEIDEEGMPLFPSRF